MLPDRSALIFAIKGVISMALALLVAMALGLERPSWAVVSAVFLQVRPETGLVIQKGLIQIGGTLIGALVGIGILAAFMPYPALALGAVALWIGLHSALSTTVRSVNYTYGFAMAGMSAALVVLLTMLDASSASSASVYEIAHARVAELIVGAACAVLVSQLLWPVSVKAGLRKGGQLIVNETLAYMSLELSENSSHEERHAHADLILDGLMAVTDDASAVTFEGPEGPGHGRAASLLCNRVMSLLAEVQILGRFQRNYPDQVEAWYRQWLATMVTSFDAMRETRDYEVARKQAQELRQQLRRLQKEQTFSSPLQFRLAKIAADLVAELIVVLRAYQALEYPDQTLLKASSIESYRDWLVAAVNASRSMLVFGIGAVVWVYTASTAAMMLMIMPVVFSIMFARLPSAMIPVVVTRLVHGVMAAAVVGMLVLGLLSQSSRDWEMLILVMSAVYFPGLLALANRPTLPYGLGFLIPMTIILQPGNGMAFNAASSLSTAFGVLTGVVVLYWVFRLITPPGDHTMQQRLLKATARDLLELAEPRERPEDWFNSRMGDRLLKLALSDRSSGSSQRHITDLGLTGLNLGHVSMRLRRLVTDEVFTPPVQQCLQEWQQALSEAYLLSADGQLNTNFRRASDNLRQALASSGVSTANLTLVEGMMERIGFTFERTATAIAGAPKS
ncbi:FUSC family protein [Oceanobacter mangrovi]|uniref:FUSC family protein n=1 Tax=Oceanobacter mangrovi TaxID=2862510 RepID=UPI001C8D593A|nr:FUSC family protein [Oceanobacter mangrovi]